VEHPAVNRRVAGSSPARGAKKIISPLADLPKGFFIKPKGGSGKEW